MHVLVPGEWTVQRGHDLLEEIEEALREAVPRSVVFTHLEPLEDPISFADTSLERSPATRWTGPHGGGRERPTA